MIFSDVPTSTIIFWSIVAIIFLYFFIRIRWIWRNYVGLVLMMHSWMGATKQDLKLCGQYCRLNSFFMLFLDFTNWNFRSYILDQEKYLQAVEFHLQLAKKMLQDIVGNLNKAIDATIEIQENKDK